MSPKVLILSKERDLAEALRFSFAGKSCDVAIVNSIKSVGGFDYVVVVNLADAYSTDKKIIGALENGTSKVVVVNGIENRQNVSVVGKPIKQIFVDQIYPICVDVLREVSKEARLGTVYAPKEAWINIATIDEFVVKIEEELFSFPENKSYLFGKLVSFRDAALSVNSSANVYVNNNLTSRLPMKGLPIVETNIKIGLLGPFPEAQKKTESRKIRMPLPRPKLKAPNVPKRGVGLAIVSLFFVLSIPYLLFLLAGIGSLVSYKLLERGDINRAESFLSLSNKLAYASSQIFVLGRALPFGEKSVVLSKSLEIGGQVLAMTDYSFEFSQGVLGEGGDINNLSVNLSLDLERLYRDISFLSGEFGGQTPFANYFPGLPLEEYRKHVLTASKIAKNLPSLLGYDRPKTYMVLLQNNMELRPTGGFIGSFALLAFSKGKLIDDTIYDVYSADGQLKGYVKPPGPIEEHLGEASWTLRDSNWDPDFLASGKNAAWFLDKTLDREIDGVIGVNLELARKYLNVLGSVELADFGDTITADNMYEKVQYEVEDNFFPGSRKKAQYLSSLSSALIERIKAGSMKELGKLLGATVASLSSRDLQFYFNDAELQKVFADAKWTGEVNSEECMANNCKHIFSGIVEANLGVNKANYFMKREAKVKISVKDGFIEQETSLFLENTATNLDRVPEQRYKGYVRALAPKSSQLVSAVLYSGAKSEELCREKKKKELKEFS